MAKRLVLQLTTADQKNPSGFQLKQLADATHSSSTEASVALDQFRVKLNNPSNLVKFKALRCLKYLCQHGRADIRQDLARNSDDVKRALDFQGQPDRLKGDALNAKVRNEAKDCLAAIFNANAAPVPTEMTGFGSTPLPAAVSASSSNTIDNTSNFNHGVSSNDSDPKMRGFGSSPIVAQEKTWQEKALEATKSKLGLNEQQTGPPPKVDFDPNFLSMSGEQASWEGKKRGKNKVGGGWDEGGDNITLHTGVTPKHATMGVTGMTSLSSPTNSSAGVGNNGGLMTTQPVQPPTGNGDFEQSLIDGLTQSAGVRQSVPPRDIKLFQQKCRSLNLEMVASACDNNLSDSNPIVQAKTLSLINALLVQNDFKVDDFEDYFVDTSESLRACLASRNGTVRNTAKKIIKNLFPDENPTPANNTQQQQIPTPQVVSQPATPSLVDIFSVPASTPTTTDNNTSGLSGGFDLDFGGNVSNNDNNITSNNTPQVDLLAGLTTAGSSTGTGGSAFGFDLGGETSGNNGNLAGNVNVASTTDMFGNLNLDSTNNNNNNSTTDLFGLSSTPAATNNPLTTNNTNNNTNLNLFDLSSSSSSAQANTNISISSTNNNTNNNNNDPFGNLGLGLTSPSISLTGDNNLNLNNNPLNNTRQNRVNSNNNNSRGRQGSFGGMGAVNTGMNNNMNMMGMGGQNQNNPMFMGNMGGGNNGMRQNNPQNNMFMGNNNNSMMNMNNFGGNGNNMNQMNRNNMGNMGSGMNMNNFGGNNMNNLGGNLGNFNNRSGQSKDTKQLSKGSDSFNFVSDMMR